MTCSRAKSRRNSAIVFGGSGLAFWAAQLLEMFACLAQLDLEGANAKADQRRLYPLDRAGLLADQLLTLAVRTARIFFGNGRNRRHAAVLWLATEPAENRPHQ
jgi:hypothetical protein